MLDYLRSGVFSSQGLLRAQTIAAFFQISLSSYTHSRQPCRTVVILITDYRESNWGTEWGEWGYGGFSEVTQLALMELVLS